MLTVTADDCHDRSLYGPAVEEVHIHPAADINMVVRAAREYRAAGHSVRVLLRVIRANRLSIQVCVLVLRKKGE